ncbi:MAG: hypothetical protein J6S67_15915 [Methanobrevibacter sp.]|nr:hypothetical protein [Methanobrevibacter sp.]
MTITKLNNELRDMGFTNVEIEIKMFMGLPWLYILVGRGSDSIKLDLSVATLEKYGAVKLAYAIYKEWHKQTIKKIFK